jgi:hypothetical protein
MTTDDIVFETSAPSAARLPEVGMSIVGHFCFAEEVPQTIYKTDLPKLWKNGKQALQARITLLVTEGTARTGKDDEERSVESGDVVAVYLPFPRSKCWETAKRSRRALKIGDVVTLTYDHDEKGEAAQSRHVWTCTIRDPESGSPWVENAKGIYKTLKSSAGQPRPSDDDGDPGTGDNEPDTQSTASDHIPF